MASQCRARVQAGKETYMLRNSERQCKRSSTAGGFCAQHQRYNLAPSAPDLMQALADSIREKRAGHA